MSKPSYLDDVDKWDNRELGADEGFVEVASPEQHEALERALKGTETNE